MCYDSTDWLTRSSQSERERARRNRRNFEACTTTVKTLKYENDNTIRHAGNGNGNSNSSSSASRSVSLFDGGKLTCLRYTQKSHKSIHTQCFIVRGTWILLLRTLCAVPSIQRNGFELFSHPYTNQLRHTRCDECIQCRTHHVQILYSTSEIFPVVRLQSLAPLCIGPFWENSATCGPVSWCIGVHWGTAFDFYSVHCIPFAPAVTRITTTTTAKTTAMIIIITLLNGFSVCGCSSQTLFMLSMHVFAFSWRVTLHAILWWNISIDTCCSAAETCHMLSTAV